MNPNMGLVSDVSIICPVCNSSKVITVTEIIETNDEDIKWLAFDGLEIFPITGKIGDNEIIWFDAADGENTIEEVYDYWLKNVKDK